MFLQKLYDDISKLRLFCNLEDTESILYKKSIFIASFLFALSSFLWWMGYNKNKIYIQKVIIILIWNFYIFTPGIIHYIRELSKIFITKLVIGNFDPLKYLLKCKEFIIFFD